MTEYSEGFKGPDKPMDETGWDMLFRTMMFPGVIPTSANALKVSTKLDGRRVYVAPGNATIEGKRYNLDTEMPVQLSTNLNNNQRIDMIVLRLDRSAQSINVVVKTGVASANPVRPTLVRIPGGTWEEPLAAVGIVPQFGGAGGSSVPADYVADERTVAVGTGLPVGFAIWEPGSLAPAPFGYYKLNTGALLRPDAFPRLAAAWGTKHGGDGVLTFGTPDMRDRHPRGASDGFPTGTALGSDTAQITQANQLPNNVIISPGGGQANYIPPSAGASPPTGNLQVTFTSGTVQPVTIRPRAITGDYWVRLC